MTTIETAFTTSISNSGLFATLTRLAGTLGTWLERNRQRRQLAELDERMLKDIGLNRTDAWQEIHARLFVAHGGGPLVRCLRGRAAAAAGRGRSR